MTGQLLNLSDPKDLEEFFKTLKEFGFKVINNQPARSILIQGSVEYFRYYGNDAFKIIIWSENAELILCKCSDYYLISLYAPGKFDELKLSKDIIIAFEMTDLAIEY
jgi:hypothetical protein